MSELNTRDESSELLVSSLKTIAISVLRTAVPIIVGWVVSLGVIIGFDLEYLTESLTMAITAVLTLGYYVIVRLLETYVTPKLGWLLGSPKQVVYVGQTPSGTATVTGPANLPANTL